MRITSKGQVTIPIEIRRQAGLFADTEVEFVMEGGDVILRRAASTSSSRGQRLVEGMRGRAEARWTTDEIMALTRGEDD